MPAAASVSMIVYLIPGLTNSGVGAADTYAEVYPHWYSKFFHAGSVVTLQRVQQAARHFPEQASGFLLRDGRLYQAVFTPVYVQSPQGSVLLNVLVVKPNAEASVVTVLDPEPAPWPELPG